MELEDLPAGRTAALRLLVLGAVEDHRDQPEEGNHRPDQEPEEERAALGPADDPGREAEEQGDDHVGRAGHRPSYRRSLISLVTAPPSALPLLSFITVPTIRPIAFSLPWRTCSAATGSASIARSTIPSSSELSEIWPSPSCSTIST